MNSNILSVIPSFYIILTQLLTLSNGQTSTLGTCGNVSDYQDAIISCQNMGLSQNLNNCDCRHDQCLCFSSEQRLPNACDQTTANSDNTCYDYCVKLRGNIDVHAFCSTGTCNCGLPTATSVYKTINVTSSLVDQSSITSLSSPKNTPSSPQNPYYSSSSESFSSDTRRVFPSCSSSSGYSCRVFPGFKTAT